MISVKIIQETSDISLHDAYLLGYHELNRLLHYEDIEKDDIVSIVPSHTRSKVEDWGDYKMIYEVEIILSYFKERK